MQTRSSERERRREGETDGAEAGEKEQPRGAGTVGARNPPPQERAFHVMPVPPSSLIL